MSKFIKADGLRKFQIPINIHLLSATITFCQPVWFRHGKYRYFNDIDEFRLTWMMLIEKDLELGDIKLNLKDKRTPEDRSK